MFGNEKSTMGNLTNNEEQMMYELTKRLSVIGSPVVRFNLMMLMGQMIDAMMIGRSEEPLYARESELVEKLDDYGREGDIMLRALGYSEKEHGTIEDFIDKLREGCPKLLEPDDE